MIGCDTCSEVRQSSGKCLVDFVGPAKHAAAWNSRGCYSNVIESEMLRQPLTVELCLGGRSR